MQSMHASIYNVWWHNNIILALAQFSADYTHLLA